MGDLFIHMLKASACLVAFYLFYRLLMRKETFHRFNRITLLSILLLAAVVPFISIATPPAEEVYQVISTMEQPFSFVEQTEYIQPAPPDFTITWPLVILFIYLSGIVFFISLNLFSLVRMLILLRKSESRRLENGSKLIVHHRKDIAPFSWMKYIVISQNDFDEDGREILIHEQAHIRNRHSIDLLITDICIILQWFNPAAWLIKQELQNVHEYEADEAVIREGVNAKQYQLLLIKKAVGKRLYSMANSFNHSKLKKRITMMSKKKSNSWARLKYLYVLPLVAISVVALARPEVSEKLSDISNVKVNDLTEMVKTIAEDNRQAATNVPDSLVNMYGSVEDVNGNPVPDVNFKILDSEQKIVKEVITKRAGTFLLRKVPAHSNLMVEYKGATTTIEWFANRIGLVIQGVENENTESAKIIFRKIERRDGDISYEVAKQERGEKSVNNDGKPYIVYDGKYEREGLSPIFIKEGTHKRENGKMTIEIKEGTYKGKSVTGSIEAIGKEWEDFKETFKLKDSTGKDVKVEVKDRYGRNVTVNPKTGTYTPCDENGDYFSLEVKSDPKKLPNRARIYVAPSLTDKNKDPNVLLSATVSSDSENPNEWSGSLKIKITKSADGKSVTIAGTMFYKDKKPMTGKTISLKYAGLKTKTDANGSFTMLAPADKADVILCDGKEVVITDTKANIKRN